MSVTKNYRQLVTLDEDHYLDRNAIESVTVTHYLDNHGTTTRISISVGMDSGARHVLSGSKAEQLLAWIKQVAVPIGQHHPQLAVEHQQPRSPRSAGSAGPLWDAVRDAYLAWDQIVGDEHTSLHDPDAAIRVLLALDEYMKELI